MILHAPPSFRLATSKSLPHTVPSAHLGRWALRPLYLAVLLVLHAPAFAQAEDPAREPSLAEHERLISIDADKAAYATEVEMRAQGKVRLRDAQRGRWPQEVQAERIDYELASDRLQAAGQVRMEQEGNVYMADQGQMRLQTQQGVFQNVTFDMQKVPLPAPTPEQAGQNPPAATGAQGSAQTLTVTDPHRFTAEDASFSMCRRAQGPAWLQDWFLRSKRLDIDTVENVAYATFPRLYFKGLPILAAPFMRFPLSSQRLSGWLPPTFSTDSRDGLSIGADYYWNIAPNRDATLTPVVKAKRGIDLGGEFRYLEDSYSGTLRGNVLPDDRLRKRTRWGTQWQHNQRIPFGLPWGLADEAQLQWQYQGVSDPNYWKDFSNAALPTPSDASTTTTGTGLGSTFFRSPQLALASGLSERLLESHAKLQWSKDRFALGISAYRYQALNDVSDSRNDFVEPSWKLPQITASYQFNQKLDAAGDYTLVGNALLDFTRFSQRQENARRKTDQRAVMQMQWGLPIEGQPGWIRPQVTLQGRHYATSTPFSAVKGGKASAVGQRQDYVLVPSVSVDAGLVFEREARLGETAYRQTLEPRVYYTYTPRVAQNHLPNNDSARKDLSFASIFEENTFSGYDRTADLHALTLAAESYFLRADSGQQLARLRAAQRFYLAPQNVVLPGESAISSKRTDILLGADIQWHPYWNLSGTAQFDPQTKRSQRYNVAVHFSPSKYRIISTAYRYQRNTTATELPLEQFDIGWQWPVSDIWTWALDKRSSEDHKLATGWGRLYAMGRLNFDKTKRRLNDAIFGLEYDADCWVARLVVERLNLGSTKPSTRYMAQLELVDFSRISFGNNPLNALQQYVLGYTPTHP